MSRRPLKMPGHRPLSRPEDRDRPFSLERRDPRLGPTPRCLSRGGSRGPGRRGGGSSQPNVKECVGAREVALKRLKRIADVHAEARQSLPEVRRELIDVLLHLRIHSLEVVEAIDRWRASSSRPAAPYVDPTTGENYLLKMKNDTSWLSDSPLDEILTFSPKSDPFFVVPSAREASTQTATNQMTPTLQARRQQDGKPRKAVLPLQASLLKRIHKAEIVILKESVQVRMSQFEQNSTEVDTNSSAIPGPVGTTVVKPSAGLHGTSLQPPAIVSDSVRSSLTDAKSVSSSLVLSKVPPSVCTSLPPNASPPEFAMYPISATVATIGDKLDRYLARVDPRVLVSLEGQQSIVKILNGDDAEGVECLEFFWLFKKSDAAESGASDARAPELADGLVVFRLRKASVSYGELLHLSLANPERETDPTAYIAAIASVKSWVFCCLPIKSLRITLWYSEQPDGKFGAFETLKDAFGKNFFRWFKLTNESDGRRGQTMQRPRGSPDDGDPIVPQDLPCFRICWGQIWMRGAAGLDSKDTRKLGACAWNLILSALCFQQLWNRDTAEAAKMASWDAEAANSAKTCVREALINSVLKGDLPMLLGRFAPSALAAISADPFESGTKGKYVSESTSTALVRHLANKLEATSASVPAAGCEVSTEAHDDLVRRLTSDAGFGQGLKELQTESLPDMIKGMQPKDAAFGRIFMSFDWLKVYSHDHETFDVAVHAAGRCPWHPHPVCYSPTTEDDIFIVIIPWANAPQLPKQEAAFAACTEILRAIQPMDPLPFSTIRLTNFAAAVPVRTTEISNAGSLGFSDRGAHHVSEFGSLLVSAGRQVPGRLQQAPLTSESSPLVVQRPFIIAVWHTALDALNVPLSATLVE